MLKVLAPSLVIGAGAALIFRHDAVGTGHEAPETHLQRDALGPVLSASPSSRARMATPPLPAGPDASSDTRRSLEITCEQAATASVVVSIGSDDPDANGMPGDVVLTGRKTIVPGLPPATVKVLWRGVSVGWGNLRDGNGTTVLHLPMARAVHIDVSGRIPTQPDVLLRIEGRAPHSVRVDGATRSIECLDYGGDRGGVPVAFSMRVPECQPLDGLLTWNPERQRLEGRVELAPAATVVVRLQASPRARAKVQLQLREGSYWRTLELQQPGEVESPDNEWLFRGLVAGEYRAREAVSKAVGAPFSVGAGEKAVVDLDGRGVVAVSGRVESPAGWRPESCAIMLEPSGEEHERVPIFLATCSPNGRFSLRTGIPLGYRLSVQHAALGLDWSRSRVSGDRERMEADFVLVEAPVVHVIVPQGWWGTGSGGSTRPHIWIRSASGSAAYGEVLSIRKGEDLLFRVPASGDYYCFVDFPGHAPRTLGPVFLRADVPDVLKLTEAERGASLVVRRAAGGQGAYLLQVVVTPETAPAWERLGRLEGSGETRVAGVAAGWARVSVFSMQVPADQLVERRISFEEGQEVRIDIE